MSVRSERGAFGEEQTALYLINRGYRILARNYRRKCGEIDIIAEKDGVIAVVEVKTRKFGSLTAGVEAVTRKKMRRIIETTRMYLYETGTEAGVRFDVAEVTITTEENPRLLEINYYENAFDLLSAHMHTYY
ncbi:MAG: YraN family protein [Ruminiclostridium sp.]